MAENKKNEISLIDLVKILYAKKILIVTVTLVGILLGGLFGAFTAGINEHTAQLQFSITSMKLDNSALHLFRSESFIEQLLLDENGLPAPEDKNNPSEDYIAAVDARSAYLEGLKRYEEIEQRIYEISVELNSSQLIFNNAADEYQYAISIYTAYVEASAGELTNNSKLDELEADMISKEQAYEAAKQAYHSIKREDTSLRSEKSLLDYKVAELQKTKNEKANALLESWRNQESTKQAVSALKKSVTFSYPTGTTSNSSEGSKLLIVDINITDSELAEHVVQRLIEYVPEYVGDVDGMLKGDECVLLSTYTDLEVSGSSVLVKNALKYAAIAGIAMLVLVCAVIVCIYIGKLFLTNVKEENGKEEISQAEPKE